MIIDFHTHTFPEKIVQSTIAKLSASADIKNYIAGTLADLCSSMQNHGIDYSVLLPVVTNPAHEKKINRLTIETNEHFSESGIISFGGIHPDNEDYKNILKDLSKNGIKGIKLHPVFQKTYFNDIRYKKIIDYAMELDLIVVTHAGYDISYPGADFVTPSHILPIIKELHPKKLVLAHMGGWNCWDEVLDQIAGCDVYLDTSFSMTPLRSPKSKAATLSKSDSADIKTSRLQLGIGEFQKIVKKHGIDRILFGSDSPWADQGECIRILKNTGLSDLELSKILGENAGRLLNL